MMNQTKNRSFVSALKRKFHSYSSITALSALIFAAGLSLGTNMAVAATTGIYGGGPLYINAANNINELKNGGFNEVIVWNIFVNSSGDLNFNGEFLICSGGSYVGGSTHSDFAGNMALLKQGKVTRITFCVGSSVVGVFQSIKTLVQSQGTGADSILYKNFQALKTAIPSIDAIDLDDENCFDQASMTSFCVMLGNLGYKVTLCPYNNSSFWTTVATQVNNQRPGTIDAVHLQCYDGGAGNSPCSWNFGAIPVYPGVWDTVDTASSVQTKMSNWRNSCNITGGWVWIYDDLVGKSAPYAKAINQALDDLQVSPPVGFTAIAAYNSNYIATTSAVVLTNGGATSFNWSIINTSAWLSVSATSGSLAANASTTVNVSLKPDVATNLAFGNYSANLVFTNTTTGATRTQVYSLNTAIVNWPISLAGFNAALIASNTATASNPGATPFDIPNKYCFFQSGLMGSSRGLPLNGAFASRADGTTAFQFGPYGATNALIMGSPYANTGSLNLVTPQSFNSLAILATSANGGGQGTLVLNFTDGTKSPVFKFNAQDWFNTVTNVAIQGFGRLNLGASLSIQDNGDTNPNLYQTTIDLASLGLNKLVSSITFSNTGISGTTAILGVSGMSTDIPVRAPTGLIAIPGTNTTVKLNWNPSSGATNYNIKYSTVSGPPYLLAGTTTGTVFTNTGLYNGTMYYFTVSAVGVNGETTNATEVAAMPGSYKGWALSWNPVAWWPLNESGGTTAYELVQGSNGVHSGTFSTSGAAGAGFGSPHRAMAYNGSTSYTQIPLLIGRTNFTIVFWVMTTTTGGSGQWYGGKGLVDGEVSGAANDFGISLVGGNVAFGIGNSDTTITSTRTINNGLWHQVAATWDSGSGAMAIYIDGTLDKTGTGPTAPRTAPPSLRIASIQTANNYFAGSISDVFMYNQVLGSSQVSTLYSAASGLFYSVPISNSWNGATLVLRWPGICKLLEATNVTGPWTTNFTASPVSIIPALPQKFYRIQNP